MYESKKKGFSLIELILVLSVIFIMGLILAVFVKVEDSSKAKKILEDINYSYSYYQDMTFNKTISSFMSEKWCCETSMAAESNFQEDEKLRNYNSKTFLAPKSSIIKVTIRSDNFEKKFLDYNYKVTGNISPEICQKIFSSYLSSALMIVTANGDKEMKYASSYTEGYDGVRILKPQGIPAVCGGKMGSIEVFLP